MYYRKNPVEWAVVLLILVLFTLLTMVAWIFFPKVRAKARSWWKDVAGGLSQKESKPETVEVEA